LIFSVLAPPLKRSWVTLTQALVQPTAAPWAIAISIFLVSVPVFFEAPLVRALPSLSLALTGFWVWAGYRLKQQPDHQFWGDLLLGFSWSWLAGSLYWGWFRWEPLWHLPMESIGLPLALWSLAQHPSPSPRVAPSPPPAQPWVWPRSLIRPLGPMGAYFYLGSLVGTAITDAYCYLIDVIPHWRRIMSAPPDQVPLIFQEAVAQVMNPQGMAHAVVLGLVLLILGLWSSRSTQVHHWIFSGTLLGTLLVDLLFIGVASFA
jgi:hypothetical protein